MMIDDYIVLIILIFVFGLFCGGITIFLFMLKNHIKIKQEKDMIEKKCTESINRWKNKYVDND